MKASDLFVKVLENEGVEYIFGIPGEENLDFLESLVDSKIKLILTRHEQGAGFMAATYGRLTGQPGVCLSTLGPGATNFVTPAAYAHLGAMPLVMLTGQKPIKTSKQGRFQILDIVRMMEPLTKYAKQIVNGYNIPSVTREAFRLAIEERPGAVHIELPEDIAAEEAGDHVFDIVGHRRPDADAKCIATAAQMIQDAKMPLLLVGAGANRKATSKFLTQFVDKTGIPFFTTQMGKGVIDERNENYLGTAALSANDYLHCAVERADLIINIGHDVIEKPPFFMEENGQKVIHINFLPAELDDVYFPQLNVVGDIGTTMEALSNKIVNSPDWDFSYYARVRQEIKEQVFLYNEDDRFPTLPQRSVQIIRDVLPEESIVTLDNGVYKLWFARCYTTYSRNSLLLDNALATMGAGLPSAMAAKIVKPHKKVVSVCGDGGFMMNSQEIETAVRLNLDLVVVILNDNAYGMIKWKQEGQGLQNFGLDLGNPDFVKYAESYGAKGYRPTSTEDFKETLDKCVNSPGVHLIDLAVDYSLNQELLNLKLQEKTCII